MLNIYFYTIASVLAVSVISLIGIFAVIIGRDNLSKIVMLLIGLSAGTLLGDSFLHLIPEAVAGGGPNLWLWLLSGILTFFILEKIVHWRHCHLPTTTGHPHPVGLMNLVGDSLHNFVDGLIIAGSFLISPALGLATVIAVVSHEVPQELGDFAVLIYAGYSQAKALFYNFISAAFSIIGALFALAIGGQIQGFTNFIIPFTAGGFIYIAASDLFPELKKDNEKLGQAFLQLLCVIGGIAIMLALKKIG